MGREEKDGREVGRHMIRYLWKFETVAVGAIGAFSLLFLIQTYTYGRRAALFPRLISWIVLFLILFFIASRVLRLLKRKGATDAEPLPAKGAAAADSSQRVRWTVTFGAAIGFCILMYLIGFGPATAFYLATHIYLAGYRKLKVIFLYALALGAMMVFIGYLFKVPLPEGIFVEPILEYVQDLWG